MGLLVTLCSNKALVACRCKRLSSKILVPEVTAPFQFPRERCGLGAIPVQKIFVTVSGGVAYVVEDTVPRGYEVEIIDFDNIGAGDDFPSDQALRYCASRGLYQPPRSTPE